MKLVEHIIPCAELQDYLDKYQDKIKFICTFTAYMSGTQGGRKYMLVIDES